MMIIRFDNYTNYPTTPVGERLNFCFTEMGVPFGEVTPWFWYLRC
ncbi:MAG: hypothetical protein ACLTZO_00260 [Ruminococcus sp.]